MNKIGYVYDPFMANHKDPFDAYYKDPTDVKTPNKHPEQPNRIHRIYQELLNRGLISKMIAVRSRLATKDELLLGHNEKYIKTISADLSIPNSKLITTALQKKTNKYSDGDVYGNDSTLECALLAAGSTINLVDALVSGSINRGVAIVRPPGHHAESSRAMGFCFFNNIGLAAIKARNAGKRVVVVDFDIHYGNATAEMLAEQDNMYFFSIHRHDDSNFYPGTGVESSCENVFNYPLNDSKGDDEVYLEIFSKQIIPKLKDISPDVILVSAGFDAAVGDPLGGYNVTPKGFRKMVELLLGVQQRLGLVLEGGYNLDAISESMAECVEALFL